MQNNVFEKSLYVGGKWIQGEGPPLSSINPATGEVISTFRTANVSQITLACGQAAAACADWSALSLDERKAYLLRFTELVKKNKDRLAQTLSLEVGKPLWESAIEVQGVIGKLDLSVEAYMKRCYEFSAGPALTRFKPHGVMVVIGPFNFPAHIPNGHIIPALLAGNTVILKPSEFTPLITHQLMELWAQAQLPPGVINLVQGASEVGKALITNPQTNGVLFTGSSKVGIDIRRTLVTRPEVILALEMGGNNPLVVHSFNDLRMAIATIIQSSYITTGQRCTCSRRLIVIENKSTTQLLKKLTQAVKHIVVGPYDQTPEPFMGPVIHPKAAKRVIEFQSNLIKKNANVLLESIHLKKDTGLVSPGLIDITELASQEDVEIFGPLLQIIRVPSLEVAVEKANDTAYGLIAGLISEDAKAYNYFFKNTKAGIINWNQPLTGSSSAVPFGGVKLSGNHRPSGFFACDYCAYPVASIENNTLLMRELPPGLNL